MNNSSNSTLLINCLIGLSTKSPDFPYPLWENGFQIETIEPRILLSDGSHANPDIQFKKNDDALLFFECKDGYCGKDQLERYKKLTIDDINRQHTTSLTEQNLVFDLAYFASKQKEEKIIPSVEKDGNPFPILILEEFAIKLNPKSSNFNNLILNNIFKEITLTVPVPRNYIPFMVDDNDKTILCALLQHFVINPDYQFTLDKLIEDLFQPLIHHFSPQAIIDLKGRLSKLLKTLMSREDFMTTIVLHNKIYHIKTTQPKKFMKNCQKMIVEMEDEILKEEKEEKKEERISQLTLGDFE